MSVKSTPAFARYIGIDYSGAKTPNDSLKGLRVYLAQGDLPAGTKPAGMKRGRPAGKTGRANKASGGYS